MTTIYIQQIWISYPYSQPTQPVHENLVFKTFSIKTSNHTYQAITYNDLTEKEKLDRDWAKNDPETEFIRYQGCIIPLENFLKCDTLPDPWIGAASDSYLSSTIIAFEGNDYKLGTLVSNQNIYGLDLLIKKASSNQTRIVWLCEVEKSIREKVKNARIKKGA